VEAARKIRQKGFVLDGEAVILGVDGISDFNALHSRHHDEEVAGRTGAWAGAGGLIWSGSSNATLAAAL
jgi:ATP-dependent DNA ligase